MTLLYLFYMITQVLNNKHFRVVSRVLFGPIHKSLILVYVLPKRARRNPILIPVTASGVRQWLGVQVLLYVEIHQITAPVLKLLSFSLSPLNFARFFFSFLHFVLNYLGRPL